MDRAQGVPKGGVLLIAVAILGVGALGARPAEAPGPPQATPREQELSSAQASTRRELDELRMRIEQLESRLDEDPERELRAEAARLALPEQIGAGRSGLTPRQEQRLAVAIVREARRRGLDPLLVAAVIEVESSFDSFAISPSGALGLMQLMPATGSWLAQRSDSPMREARNLLDFERNVELGCGYLAELVERFGSVEDALLAYNIGPAAALSIVKAGGQVRARALAGYPRRVLEQRERLRAAAASGSARALDAKAVDPPG
jgi:soluble lytic murein transglycosylase